VALPAFKNCVYPLGSIDHDDWLCGF